MTTRSTSRLLLAAAAALATCAALPSAAAAGPGPEPRLPPPGAGYAGSHLPERASFGGPLARPSLFERRLVGPDVSMWQGCEIDWRRVRTARRFAFAKATEGITFDDPCFARNWARMRAAGLLRGAYHFARPEPPIASDARREANHYVEVVRAAGGFRRMALPPVLDLEASTGLSQRGLRLWIHAWVARVKARTRRRVVVIYTGPSFWGSRVGAWAPRGTLLWAASWGSTRPRVSGFALPAWWQYTDGRVGPTPHSSPGLGAADHSVFLGSRKRLRRLGGLR